MPKSKGKNTMQNGGTGSTDPFDTSSNYASPITSDHEDDFGTGASSIEDSNSFMQTMNKLQSNCRHLRAEYGIDIPTSRIAVIGGQTSGKSSTLENIAQAGILPKGSGTVTKCPIELRFLHSDTTRYKVGTQDISNPAKVEAAIKKQSDYLAKRDGGISSEIIEVEIQSPHVPNMTLVDLPGLIEMHRKNQEADLPERIRTMVLSCIQNEKTIILIVAPANEDLMNSNIIKLAREADKEGLRTFAVFTKLDTINTVEDEQTFEANLALARESLRLGAAGVVNRSASVTFEAAREKEANQIRKLFPTDTEARKHGIKFVENQLSRIQLQQIQGSLHEIMDTIHTHLRQENRVLDEVGFGEITNKRDIMKQVVDNFARRFIAQVDGSHRNIDFKEFGGGVSIKQVLYHDFKVELDTLDNGINPSDKAMVISIANANGATGMNSLTELAFDTIVEDEILKMEEASLKCLDSVYTIMRTDVPERCFSFVPRHNKIAAASRFPKLQIAIQLEVDKLLRYPKEVVKDKILDYICTQAEIPSSSHPDFLKKWEGNESMIAFSRSEMEFLLSENGRVSAGTPTTGNPAQTPKGPPNAVPGIDRVQVQKKLDFLKDLVKIYFKILKGQVEDHVPKMIKKHLVFFGSNEIQAAMTEFRSAVFDQNLERDLIAEGDEVTTKRKDALEKKRMLEEALFGFENIQHSILSGGGDWNPSTSN